MAALSPFSDKAVFVARIALTKVKDLPLYFLEHREFCMSHLSKLSVFLWMASIPVTDKYVKYQSQYRLLRKTTCCWSLLAVDHNDLNVTISQFLTRQVVHLLSLCSLT